MTNIFEVLFLSGNVSRCLHCELRHQTCGGSDVSRRPVRIYLSNVTLGICSCVV